ncbi:MAG: 16S rRNA processing protein RimM, partial [Bacteriovoracaceae bacterium]|nr:16S rRNA processing protein RimM [Bacteriovoracaceae bacterium]
EDLKVGSLFIARGKNSKSSLHKKTEQLEIEKINFGHKVMVKLKNIDNRNTVEEMIPFSILLEREVIDELHEGEMLVQDYIGMDAVEFETNRKLGKVSDLYETAAQVILVIGTGEDSFEIPDVEHFVKEVDLDQNKITILVPEIVE